MRRRSATQLTCLAALACAAVGGASAQDLAADHPAVAGAEAASLELREWQGPIGVGGLGPVAFAQDPGPGDTVAAFAAAAVLGERQGWRAGLSARGAATLSLAGRAEEARRWEDVAVDAAIGEAVGRLVATPLPGDAQLVPWASRRGAGVRVSGTF